MAKARQIVKRRRAVRNIRKITQTMQLIATARFQKALQRATASKPYTERISEMIQTLAGRGGEIEHPLLRANPGVRQGVLLIITSNRGMCGSYNAAVLRNGIDFAKAQDARGLTSELDVVGKKGLSYLRFLGRPVATRITDVEDKIAFSRVAEMAERYMTRYQAGQIASVDVAYMRFASVGTQIPAIARLLPIEPPEAQAQPTAPGGPAAGEPGGPLFEFLPAPETLLRRLIPETVKIRLYQFFNDAIVSEQVARMVAMKAATDAAGEMIKSLTREYNRARQSQITLELADIVGGAAAIE